MIAVPGDLREARVILEDPGLRELLEPGQPVAVVLGAVLHYIDGQQAYEAVDYLKQALPPGSYLVISHATADEAGQDETREVRSVYGCASAPLTLRTAAEVGRFFDGLELAEPGVTGVAAWRNKGAGRRERSLCYGGVGRKN